MEQGYEVTGFFYNPNIHPFMEYRARKEAVNKFAEIEHVTVIFDSYDFTGFLSMQLEETERPERCKRCYIYRLKATAQYAKNHNFDAFTTTMLSSHQQYHDVIREIGAKCADAYDVPFYYEDFRKGIQQGNAVTKTYGLYRQKYCGCLFSEWERFGGKNIEADTKNSHP
jgi:predicted adenine nucleotide alpha hydrolase (AANH) superfamily ATPase